MTVWSSVFLIIGLIAGGLGLSGISGTAVAVAWALCVLGLALAGALFWFGRHPPAES